MRNQEPIEEPGYFWLSTQPETKLPGTLYISESCEITLEILGMFGDPIAALKKPGTLSRIVGLIRSEYITLDLCAYKRKNVRFSGISKSIITAKFAFLGVAYDDKEVIRFSKFVFSVEGLDEWLLITGIKTELNADDLSVSIQYDRPKDISLQLPGDINLTFLFSYSMTGGGTELEAKINQKAFIALHSKTEKPIEDFLSLVYKINLFLCFAIDKTVSLDFTEGFSQNLMKEGEPGKTVQQPVRIYHKIIPHIEPTPKIYWHDMLFRYDQVAEDLEGLLAKWLANYQLSEPAFNLYFAYKSGAQRYIDGRFLSLVQGIETLHRRNSTKTLMPSDEFKRLVQTLLGGCPSEKKQWLNARIAYGNELPLRQRLTEMIEPFQALYGTKEERITFIEMVIDTRNYLTHYDEKLSDKAATGIPLWRLCMKIEVLFQLHFLRLMGLSEPLIKTLAMENESIKWKLKQ
ncbi:MAG: hypothetical protein KF722_05810 [Nitrospira sp.]|nr:hypothetical protein [Nitrospira sp.]